MNNIYYNRLKMFSYCSNDNTSDYMKRYNLGQHKIRIDKIKNRKNHFLPKINSQRNINSPIKRINEQKIEDENLQIYKSLFSIDHRLPVLSEKKYLNKRYIKELKKERSELNKYQINMLNNLRKENCRKLLFSPISSKHKDKYKLYNSYIG